jgi:hypothetical protein
VGTQTYEGTYTESILHTYEGTQTYEGTYEGTQIDVAHLKEASGKGGSRNSRRSLTRCIWAGYPLGKLLYLQAVLYVVN